MARKTIAQLTALFETGDTPVGADFASIFDSNWNIVDGSATGDLTLTGSLTISGSQAFILDTTNVVLGQNAGGGSVDTGTDDNNVIIGTDAAGGGALNSGDNNIVIGHSAGYALSTGDNNIIIGYEAGKVNTATANTFIGSRSGQKNTTGYYNTFVGRDSGMECVEWQNNTYVGYGAGKNPQNEMNTAVGSEALLGASGTNTAEQNVALGYRALYAIASNGDGNVAVGHQAGLSITSGTHNINIGFGATSTATAVGDIRIGSGSTVPFSGSSVTGDVLFPSTASAAYFVGNGSQLTNLPASSPFPLSGSAIISSSYTAGDTNSNALKVIASGSVSGSGIVEFEGSTGQLFSSIDSMSGSLMAVTDASGIPILEVFSDATVEAKGFKGYRPIETRTASFVLQLSDMGTYNRCGGVAVTASLSGSAGIPFAIGTEIEFFQTSSDGNLLITASAGSGVTINSKDGNLQLAGQFSAATLKKVGSDEWDLIGDLG